MAGRPCLRFVLAPNNLDKQGQPTLSENPRMIKAGKRKIPCDARQLRTGRIYQSELPLLRG